MIDEILAKYKLRYDQLNSAEKETLRNMLESVNQAQLTPDRLAGYIHAMRASVEEELYKEPEYVTLLFFKVRNDKNILLKARLRNYVLLEAFLESPKKAKEALEKALANIKPVK